MFVNVLFFRCACVIEGEKEELKKDAQQTSRQLSLNISADIAPSSPMGGGLTDSTISTSGPPVQIDTQKFVQFAGNITPKAGAVLYIYSINLLRCWVLSECCYYYYY